jgi:putative ABC transport system permease protein
VTQATHLPGVLPAGAPTAGATPRRKASPLLRWRSMARVGIRMMFHDKLKMIGTLAGVIFSVLLTSQQAGTFIGLLQKNTMFLDNAGADLWILPPTTESLQPGKTIPSAAAVEARVLPGVAWAEPLLFGGGNVALPGGGSEAVQVVGTRLPRLAGGPWNIVAGSAAALARPDTMLFEDSEREKLGGLNLGSVREVNGRDVTVGGFTWGLLPFGPSFAFADFDLARELLKIDSDQAHFVLVGAEPGADLGKLKQELAARLPATLIMTRDEFSRSTVHYILVRTAIGVTLGTSAAFGLVIGFVIVALTTFSAVIDNLREFGTLKAIGATTWDLAKLLLVQSTVYALLGSLIGLALVTQVANAIRSPKFALILPPKLLLAMPAAMIVLCILASSLALVRLRKLEPAMVFR